MRPLSASIVITALALSAGCAKHESAQPIALASQPTTDRGESYFRFDDPRCSEDQRRAIRAATKAVIGTDKPSAKQLERLHFLCEESGDRWMVTVERFGPNEIPAPGEYTGVILNRDFTVRDVIGSA